MLKKLFIVAIVSVVSLSAGVIAFSRPMEATVLRFEMNSTTFTSNGVPRQVDVAPYIDAAYDRAMLPLRAIAEELGTTVNWIDGARTVILERGGISISLSVDMPLPDGMGMPQIVDDRTMVPIRYIAETLGASVAWNEDDNSVHVTESTPQDQMTPTPTPQTPVVTPTPAPQESISINLDEFERRIFELTNVERANYGLPPLIWDPSVAAVARAHSDDLAINNLFGHTGSDGSDVGQRLARAGISYRNWAENVIGGRSTPEAAVAGWMDSPGHRANILNRNVTHLGVGVHHSAGSRFRFYATQKFVLLAQPTSTQQPHESIVTPSPQAPTVTPSPALQEPSSINLDDFERRVFELTNVERANNGLPPLIWDSGLASAARAHSDDLARNNLFGHTGSDGSSVGERLSRAGISHRGWAENVSGGRNTPEATVAGWMASPGHRSNILNRDMTHLGVGLSHLEGSRFSFYATQKFAIQN